MYVYSYLGKDVTSRTKLQGECDNYEDRLSVFVWLKPWGLGDFSTFYVEEQGVKTKDSECQIWTSSVFF